MTAVQLVAVLAHLFTGEWFYCHSTTEIAPDGTLTADHAAPCAGSLMFAENCARSDDPRLRLLARCVRRPEGYNPARLRGWGRVFTTIAELFAAALPAGSAPRHAAYVRPADGGPLKPLK